MERLNSEQLKREQRQTLASPHALRFSRPPAILLDGSSIRTEERMSKFKVLEIIARVPYQAWENVAYVAMTHSHTDPIFARRIFDRIKESRIQQDNEQWHLLIIGELIAKRGIDESLLLQGFIAQMIAFFLLYFLDSLCDPTAVELSPECLLRGPCGARVHGVCDGKSRSRSGALRQYFCRGLRAICFARRSVSPDRVR